MKKLESFNLFSIAVAVAMLIIALSVAYYLVIYLPSLGKAKQELENKKFEQMLSSQAKEEVARKECIEELRSAVKDKPNYTIETANAIYRRCLAEKGFEPEDLVKP